MLSTKQRKYDLKRVTITSKRQFTIPQKFYSELRFDKEAICIMGNGMLIIRPALPEDSGEYAQQILEELIKEGYSGEALLKEFKTRQAKIRPAVEAMLDEAKAVAKEASPYSSYDDVF